MEQGMNPQVSCRKGFLLVTVLIVTAVGLLFGAGALLLFRYQCQMRIDRQHELEKVYAVRSVMNYIRTYAYDIGEEGKPFEFNTESERKLGLLVKPVESIFPNLRNPGHLDIGNKGKVGRVFNLPMDEQYSYGLDYEYGSNATNALNEHVMQNRSERANKYGLAFTDLESTNNVKWWVNIGMRNTGGWLHEDYGRRYYFSVFEQVKGTEIKDIMRLCIIRNVTNEHQKAGRRHGWPLSKGERALVFELRPIVMANEDRAEVGLYDYEGMDDNGLDVKINTIHCETNWIPRGTMGMQMAGDRISIFYIDNDGLAAASSHGYIFSDAFKMDEKVYAYFSEGCLADESERIIESPELRAVFEVEATSDMRNGGDMADYVNFLTDFYVKPAYQYDIFLEYPATVTNLATVAQKIGKYGRLENVNQATLAYTILTYDTHGTENKGFRKDERDFERKRSR